MKTTHRLSLILLLLAGTAGCDQATKRIATTALRSGPAYSYLADTFRLQYAENSGAFLSLGSGFSDSVRFWVFVVGVALMLAGLLFYALFNRKLGGLQVAGLALSVGGGLSNWIDRALNDGAVVDFMNLGVGRLRTGIFNVADVAIFAGLGLLMLAGRRQPVPVVAGPPVEPPHQ